VRTYILAAPAAILFLMMMLLLTTTASAVYAVQFSFDPSSGEPYGQVDFGMPALLIGLAAITGFLLVINERRKAKGIWFSNNERMR
jgi:hypothetical protein